MEGRDLLICNILVGMRDGVTPRDHSGVGADGVAGERRAEGGKRGRGRAHLPFAVIKGIGYSALIREREKDMRAPRVNDFRGLKRRLLASSTFYWHHCYYCCFCLFFRYSCS